jgi:hypothetical protein
MNINITTIKYALHDTKTPSITTLSITTLSIVTFIQHNETQHSDTQHSDTQHSDTQHSDTQHSDTQHSDTQHSFGIEAVSINGLFLTLSINTLCSAECRILLSIILSVIMLNVVGPFNT